MLTKVLVFGLVLASAPVLVVTQTQDDAARPSGARGAPADAVRERQARELRRLQGELRRLRARCQAAEGRVEALHGQLEECLDMLQSCNGRRRNCTPSRAAMIHYQWMRRHGHEERAKVTLERVIEQSGDDNDDLNRLAWRLMTDEDTAGRFDELALALAERMLADDDDLGHRELDTVALAKFLNGEVGEAIELQRRAIEAGGNSDDYRRRLRTYEAALESAAERAEPRGAGKIHDD